MKKEDYGEKYKDHLLEQYKLLSASINKLGERRAQTNRFYISVLSGLIIIASFSTTKNIFTDFQTVLYAIIALLGITLCIIWRLNIKAFGVTSARRYQVLNEIEKELPSPIYGRAWELLKQDKNNVPMAVIELYTPYVLLVPYLLLLAYSIWLFISNVSMNFG